MPICFKFHESNLHHENHENLYTMKFNMLTVCIFWEIKWPIPIFFSCETPKKYIKKAGLEVCYELAQLHASLTCKNACGKYNAAALLFISCVQAASTTICDRACENRACGVKYTM